MDFVLRDEDAIVPEDVLCTVANRVRGSIEAAKRDGAFRHDELLRHFPLASCGRASYLLAQALKEQGVDAILVSGKYGDQNHMWLVVKDALIMPSSYKPPEIPAELDGQLVQYGRPAREEEELVKLYCCQDIAEGTIVDITVDQFGEQEFRERGVYVGKMNPFYKRFCDPYTRIEEYAGELKGKDAGCFEIISNYF